MINVKVDHCIVAMNFDYGNGAPIETTPEGTYFKPLLDPFDSLASKCWRKSFFVLATNHNKQGKPAKPP